MQGGVSHVARQIDVCTCINQRLNISSWLRSSSNVKWTVTHGPPLVGVDELNPQELRMISIPLEKLINFHLYGHLFVHISRWVAFRLFSLFSQLAIFSAWRPGIHLSSHC